MSLEQRLREELKTVSEQVKALLDKYPEARNSDTYLEWLWMRYYKGINMPWLEYSKLQDFSLETVRRNRAKIQSEGFFLPTREDVLLKRRLKQRVYHDAFAEDSI